MRGLMHLPLRALAEARGILFPWVPVMLSCGIGLWFALPFEPEQGHYAICAAALGLALVFWRLGPETAQPFAVATGCLVAGLLLAGGRAHLVAQPMLEFRYYGPVQGRIVGIDRSQSDALRLTLDRVVLERVPPARTPARVRVALHGAQGFLTPEPGQVVILTGHLAAPEGAVEPGGFDFRRMAFFLRLGAVGYTRNPVLLWEDPTPREQVVNRLRTRASAAVQAAIPGDPGAFAAGVMTGDRSGLSRAATEALRATSLAHILAISGMHMAFLTGFVFAVVRGGLALIAPLALRVDTRKVAAVVALLVALFYLLLSGANVATERAFIMVTVMLGAVLLNRRALSLRSVALAATILLALRPESLLEPGFRMSFAATTALIAGFGALPRGVIHRWLPGWALPMATLILSSALAGLATAPFAAAQFNRVADYGFFANLATVPVMGAVVMPAGAVAALATPLGLEALPLWLMGLGTGWILGVAHWMAALDGAVTAVAAPGPWVLPLLAFGGIWLAVWRGWLRLAGLLPMLAAFALWAQAGRPDLLISADGRLAGLMGAEGRALSAPRGGGFTATSWLAHDGDLADQETAAARSGFAGEKSARRFRLGQWDGVLLNGKDAAARLSGACAGAQLVILALETARAPEGCRLIDGAMLRRAGGMAIRLDAKGGLHLQPTRAARRIWDGPGEVPLPPMVWPAPLEMARSGQ